MLRFLGLLVFLCSVTTYIISDGLTRFKFVSKLMTTHLVYDALLLNQTDCSLTSVDAGIISIKDIPNTFGYTSDCGSAPSPNYTYMYALNSNLTNFAGYDIYIMGTSCDLDAKNYVDIVTGVWYTNIVITCIAAIMLITYSISYTIQLSPIGKQKLTDSTTIVTALNLIATLGNTLILIGQYIYVAAKSNGSYYGEERYMLYAFLLELACIYCMAVIIQENRKQPNNIL